MPRPKTDVRLALLLLRLYPRTWRERYGEEFLILISDTGLTWRVIGDVLLAASGQRIRGLLALRNPDPLAGGSGRTFATLDAWDLIVAPIVFGALVLIATAVLSPLGLAWPGWMWLFMTTNNFQILDGALALPGASNRARIVRGCYFFTEGLLLGIVLWLVSRGLARAGVPAPPDGFELVFVTVGLMAVGRLIQLSSRRASRPDEWAGVRRGELAAWRAVGIVFWSLVIIAEPETRMIWHFATFWYLIGRTPFGATALNAARARAAAELNQQRLREKFPVQAFPRDWQ